MQNKETLIIMMTSFKNEYDLLANYFSNKNDKTTIPNVDAAKDCFVLLSFSGVSLVIVGIPAVEGVVQKVLLKV